MLRASISERTTFRWDLAEELAALHLHGFDTLSLWRPKLSDLDQAEARKLLDTAGVRVSSLQWAGGFTGSDGRSFQESLTDAHEAIDEAAAIGAEVLLVHTGCRTGHTLGHARRLVQEALERLAPHAHDLGLRLALKPTHPAASAGCGFLTQLDDAARFIEEVQHPCVGLALDLWHFGHQQTCLSLLPSIINHVHVVAVADCLGGPTAEHDRLPPGEGNLPLRHLLTALLEAGYRGDVEFEFVAEPLAASVAAGYHEALRRTRRDLRSYGCFTTSPKSSRPASSPSR
jgi:sugar phosphate isomerase/epimerase